MRQNLELERDASRYIDFSTPPLVLGHSPEPFLISDISNTIFRFSSFNHMVMFYRRFPLTEIIETLLSISLNESASPGHWDYLAFQTEEKLGHFVENVNMDSLFLFYENLIIELEQEISRKSPTYQNVGDYVFYQWIDPVSICLCLENSPMRPHNQKPRYANELGQYGHLQGF